MIVPLIFLVTRPVSRPGNTIKMPSDEENLVDVLQLHSALASYLPEANTAYLSSIVSLREDTSDQGLNKAAIYTCFILHKKTGSTDYLRKAITFVDEWLDNAEGGCPSRLRQILCSHLEKADRRASLYPFFVYSNWISELTVLYTECGRHQVQAKMSLDKARSNRLST